MTYRELQVVAMVGWSLGLVGFVAAFAFDRIAGEALRIAEELIHEAVKRNQ